MTPTSLWRKPVRAHPKCRAPLCHGHLLRPTRRGNCSNVGSDTEDPGRPCPIDALTPGGGGGGGRTILHAKLGVCQLLWGVLPSCMAPHYQACSSYGGTTSAPVATLLDYHATVIGTRAWASSLGTVHMNALELQNSFTGPELHTISLVAPKGNLILFAGDPTSTSRDLPPTLDVEVTPTLAEAARAPKGVRFVADSLRRLHDLRTFLSILAHAPLHRPTQTCIPLWSWQRRRHTCLCHTPWPERVPRHGAYDNPPHLRGPISWRHPPRAPSSILPSM